MAKGKKIPAKKVAKEPRPKTVKPEPDELNDQVIRFCDNYLIHFNASKAAEQAGYSAKTAAQQASRLLTKVKVQNYLTEKGKKIAQKMEVSQEKTMLEIARIAFQDARQFYKADGSLIPIHQLDDDAAAVIAGMEVEEITLEGVVIGRLKKIKRYDKVRALEMLAKHYKIFEDGPVINNNLNVGNLSAGDLKTLLALKQKAKV